MIAIRSLLFNIAYIGWNLLLSVLYIPAFLLPRKVFLNLIRFWLAGTQVLARIFVGIRWQVRGLEHLPDGPAIIAAKHQSAFDTFLFHKLLKSPVYVLKKELTYIPLLGQYMLKSGMVAIDRKAGGAAIKKMLTETDAALAEGAQVIIFPEGTRTAPGARLPYHPGVAALYTRFKDVPVIPVALNTGRLWGRDSFMKTPGLVTLEFLPAMPSGMDRKAFMVELENRIEAACERLYEEPV